MRVWRAPFSFLARVVACIELLSAAACIELPRLPQDGGAIAARHDAEDPPEDAPTGPNGVRLGAFNVRRLGFDARTDIAMLAQLIDRHFDLLALTEVMQTGDFGHAGYDALLEALGPAWAGQITSTPRPNLRSPFAEYYAVLRRPSRVALCPGAEELVYHPEGDGRAPAELPDHFLREPAFGCYVLLSPSGAPAMDFVLGVYHARWGDGDQAAIAREVAGLDAVLLQQAARFGGEQDVLLVGDFNLPPHVLARIVSAQVRTQGRGSTLNPEGYLSDNLYDHLLVLHPDRTTELVTDAQVLDLRAEAGGPAAYAHAISDHLPILALLDASGPDDD
jgi:hypothetical protein